MIRYMCPVSLSLACAFALAACGDDGSNETVNVEDASTSDAGDGDGDGGGDDGPVFALSYAVLQEGDNRVSYQYLSKTLELPARIRTEDSKEFYGYSNSAVVDGHLLTSDEGSVMRKYAISDDLEWTQVDEMSFANYEDLDDVGFWRQHLASPTSGFLLHNTTDRLIWNPTTFKIGDDVTDTMLPLMRDGLALAYSAHRDPSPNEVWDGPVLRPFQYEGENEDGEWITSHESFVVRYAPETFEEEEVYEVPCPALQVPSHDEDGNTYYSDHGYDAHRALFPGDWPRPCVARFDGDGEYEPDFTTDFSSWTDGRLVGTFRYIRDGIAVAVVLHHEETDIDFTEPFSEEASAELAKHWYLWIFDLENETAEQTSLQTSVPRAFMSAAFGDRYFILPVPWDPVAETQNYEIELDGTVKEAFVSPGFAYTFAQVR